MCLTARRAWVRCLTRAPLYVEFFFMFSPCSALVSSGFSDFPPVAKILHNGTGIGQTCQS